MRVGDLRLLSTTATVRGQRKQRSLTEGQGWKLSVEVRQAGLTGSLRRAPRGAALEERLSGWRRSGSSASKEAPLATACSPIAGNSALRGPGYLVPGPKSCDIRRL